MSLPFFYAPGINSETVSPELEEETARHIVQVLRMKPGEELMLTNGTGLTATAVIESVSKKNCVLSLKGHQQNPANRHRTAIAISPLKNPSRFEWFLEKSAEFGVSAILPLLCKRTEKQFIKKERWTSILVSAMLQSQQSWLTELHDPVKFNEFILTPWEGHRYIAHCMEGRKQQLQQLIQPGHDSSLILIGPEGDFTPEELSLALEHDFTPVSLGSTRLRTETAGIKAAMLLTLGI